MGEKTIAAGAVAAIIISFGAGYIVRGSKQGVPLAGHTMDSGMTMGNTQSAMQGMMAGLIGKSGDAFDQAFLAEMTLHHQGAIAMAQAALVSAKHDELKRMANDIIAAQTAEVAQMQVWQTSWYGIASQ